MFYENPVVKNLWISVKDRLPELNKPVIVYIQTLDEVTAGCLVKSLMSHKLIWDVIAHGKLTIGRKRVTLWRELPSSPTKFIL